MWIENGNVEGRERQEGDFLIRGNELNQEKQAKNCSKK